MWIYKFYIKDVNSLYCKSWMCLNDYWTIYKIVVYPSLNSSAIIGNINYAILFACKNMLYDCEKMKLDSKIGNQIWVKNKVANVFREIATKVVDIFSELSNEILGYYINLHVHG